MKSGVGGASQAEAHQSEAIRLASGGRLSEAIEHFEAAARLDPGTPSRHFNCGRAWQQLGDPTKAAAAYSKTIAIAPDFFDAWCNLCAALKSLGSHVEAVAAGRQAIRFRPGSAAAWLNLGNAHKAAGDWEPAEIAYRTACELDPNNARAALNLGNTLRETGRLQEAVRVLSDTVVRHSEFAEAHRDLAFALLISGDFSRGWIENEWRWGTEGLHGKRRPLVPGSAAERVFPTAEQLKGKRVLVYTEQGFGDAIQFVRYVEPLSKLGATVCLQCSSPLVALFRSVRGADRVMLEGEPLPAIDFQIPLLSLPRIFNGEIPSTCPYLHPPSIPLDLPSTNSCALKIGLAWAGNPKHENDARRSLSPALLNRLVAVLGGADLCSLQTGAHSTERSQCERIVDLSKQLTDFGATAAVIDRLDLVISVDTSVAHLAGALGKPVWILLPLAPDWRWILGTDRSAWYPTARLFRQSRRDDWESVIANVGKVFAKGVSGGMANKPIADGQ